MSFYAWEEVQILPVWKFRNCVLCKSSGAKNRLLYARVNLPVSDLPSRKSDMRLEMLTWIVKCKRKTKTKRGKRKVYLENEILTRRILNFGIKNKQLFINKIQKYKIQNEMQKYKQ